MQLPRLRHYGPTLTLFARTFETLGPHSQAESDGGALQLPGEWLLVEGPKPQFRF